MCVCVCVCRCACASACAEERAFGVFSPNSSIIIALRWSRVQYCALTCQGGGGGLGALPQKIDYKG